MEQKGEKKCYICGIKATILCIKCNSYFCEECSKFIHKKEKNIEHKLEKIDYFTSIDFRCPIHPQDRINLFCVDEKGKKVIKLF